MSDDFVPTFVKALRALKPGKPGIEQPHHVRGKTLAMEKAGLIAYRDDGWHLTDAGKTHACD